MHFPTCNMYKSSLGETASILRPYGIQVYFNSPPNLAALLRNPITKADAPNNPIHSTGAVYAVSCQDCPASYVGETGRTAESRQDNPNEGHHSEEGKKTVQIEKRERVKMEEQTNQSNDTAEQSVPKQETTFVEEETSPSQGTSTDPLTQIADALSKLLVTRSPREIDVSPYDGTFEAQSFFDNFDSQADRAVLTYTDRLRKLPCYLQEDYYQNKTVMGMKINLPADILIESLTDGLPVADQRLIATVQPNTIKEWFDLVSRIRGTQCATSAVYQRQVDKAPHPTYHNPPPRYNNQRSSRVTYQVTPPPSPCKYCNAMHWHSQCEQRFLQSRTRPVYSAIPRTTTVLKHCTHTRPKVQSPSHVPQVQAASQDDYTSPASNSTAQSSGDDVGHVGPFHHIVEQLNCEPNIPREAMSAGLSPVGT
ncbi:hypothetical protein LAZ67_6003364 [Cordylochernes scorpioides]|uniref:Gag protein n=1 Tax=Cordylochernes scorpioides TaxID=51811 RepID=A0ABY6KNH5_9ARAC|nr:hypothetical protein LAZ67_6003364 [Cordylochernes scorpioides]